MNQNERNQNASAAPPGTSDPGLTRWSRLLNKIDKDPDSALEDPRCLQPYFLARFFDLCDGKALEAPYVAHDYSAVAVELARRTGDPHLIHRAASVAAHAFIGNGQWQEAAEALEEYHQQALDCCPACAADWLKRYGDLLIETSDPRYAQVFLEGSARTLGDQLDHDARGRLLSLRGVAHHLVGETAAAIFAAGRSLQLLSLSSPQGFFLDAVAYLACFVEHTDDRRLDEHALDYVDRFKERIKGLRGWQEVNARVHWVEGQLHGRLGHPRRARRRLERARKAHVKHAPHHWALAIAVDEALVYSRGSRPELFERPVHVIVLACVNELKLDAQLTARLAELHDLLFEARFRTEDYLSEFRRSFVVPVPGLLVDYPAEDASDREWSYGSSS